MLFSSLEQAMYVMSVCYNNNFVEDELTTSKSKVGLQTQFTDIVVFTDWEGRFDFTYLYHAYYINRIVLRRSDDFTHPCCFQFRGIQLLSKGLQGKSGYQT